jgi:hypothetical protein
MSDARELREDADLELDELEEVLLDAPINPGTPTTEEEEEAALPGPLLPPLPPPFISKSATCACHCADSGADGAKYAKTLNAKVVVARKTAALATATEPR